MVRLAHLLVRLVALPPHLLGRRRLLLLLLRRTSDLSFVSTSSEKVFCCWAWLAFIDFSIFPTCAAIIFESVASLIPETMSEVSATGCEKRGILRAQRGGAGVGRRGRHRGLGRASSTGERARAREGRAARVHASPDGVPKTSRGRSIAANPRRAPDTSYTATSWLAVRPPLVGEAPGPNR